MRVTTNHRDTDRSLGTLVSEATREFSALFRAEVQLARVEIKHEVAKAGQGAALLAGAGVLAGFAAVFVSAALGLGLWSLGLPGWVAALIVGVLYAAAAAILAVIGKKRFAAVRPPQRTIETLKEDVEWARNRKS